MGVTNIPFNDWSKKRLWNGTKTATSRTKKYGKTGDIFHVGFGDYEHMTFQIDYIFKETLGNVVLDHYKEEGAETPQELIDVWKTIHPRKGYRKEQMIFYHKFHRIAVVPSPCTVKDCDGTYRLGLDTWNSRVVCDVCGDWWDL